MDSAVCLEPTHLSDFLSLFMTAMASLLVYECELLRSNLYQADMSLKLYKLQASIVQSEPELDKRLCSGNKPIHLLIEVVCKANMLQPPVANQSAWCKNPLPGCYSLRVRKSAVICCNLVDWYWAQ